MKALKAGGGVKVKVMDSTMQRAPPPVFVFQYPRSINPHLACKFVYLPFNFSTGRRLRPTTEFCHGNHVTA